MNNIAMFVETYEPAMGEEKRQTLFVPYSGETLVYSRLTDGTPGKGNRWEKSTLDELLKSISANEYITVQPFGVNVTAADEEAITETGWSPVLSTKAMAAYNKSDSDQEFGSVQSRIESIHSMVTNSDPRLSNHVHDLRRERDTEDVATSMQPTQTIAPDTAEAIEAPQQSLRIALATIPPVELADKYVNRKLTGNILDFDLFDYALDNGLTTLIYGPTGPGKTRSIIAWSASRRRRVAAVSGNAALEPSQLIGKYVPDGNGGFEWIDGPVTDVVRNGGTLILDELNFISPKIYTILYSLLDGRRCLILLDHHGETIEAHPDLAIFATMNPDYVGTTPLNFAMRNRFELQVPWDYDDEVESKLITHKSLLVIAKQLRAEAARGDLETPVSTNMFMELEKLIKFNYEFAITNFVAHFDKEEQEKVALVMMTHDYNIKEDFGLVEAEPVQDETRASVTEEVADWLSKSK